MLYNGSYDNIFLLQLQDDDSDEEPPLQPPEENNPLYSQDQFIADFNNPAYRQHQEDPRDLGSRSIGTSVLGTESVEMDELVPLSPQEMANMEDEQRDIPIGQSDTLY